MRKVGDVVKLFVLEWVVVFVFYWTLIFNFGAMVWAICRKVLFLVFWGYMLPDYASLIIDAIFVILTMYFINRKFIKSDMKVFVVSQVLFLISISVFLYWAFGLMARSWGNNM